MIEVQLDRGKCRIQSFFFCLNFNSLLTQDPLLPDHNIKNAS